MNISEFLRRRGVDLPSVITAVEAAVGLHADDVLLGVGSIVEGLGNSKSDIDLLLITARDLGDPAHDELGLVISRCLVDLRILRTSWLDEVVGRLRRCGQARWEVTHPVKFTPDERSLLHRLLHGRLLSTAGQALLDARLPSRAELARLSCRSPARWDGRSRSTWPATGRAGTIAPGVRRAGAAGHAVDALTAATS